MSLNKVQLIGRVGKDPESRNLDNGKTVTNFSLATSEKYKNKSGETVEDTQWHNIVLWGKPAEVAAKYVSKGDQIYIEGKLQTRSWEKDGVTKYITEVVGNNLVLLGTKGGGSNHTPAAETPSTSDSTDDLPF